MIGTYATARWLGGAARRWPTHGLRSARVMPTPAFCASSNAPTRCPFGTILGVCDDISVYSCYNAACPKKARGLVHFHNGVFTGLQWQCVELARRYLVVRSGVTFSSIRFAYEIFAPTTGFATVADERPVAVDRCHNGAPTRPRAGSLLIWDHGGHMKETGHVAVITRVTDDYVDIIEQNHDDVVWPLDQDYSRRLAVSVTKDGYAIAPASTNETILGWINIPASSPSRSSRNAA